MVEQAILRIICNQFGVTRYELTTRVQPRGRQEVVKAKQTAAFFLKRIAKLDLQQIAAILDYASPQAVSNGINKVKEVTSGNKADRAELEEIQQKYLDL